MPTLLDYLTIRDPGNLDRADVLTGTNTLDPLWEDIDDTREWQGFTYDNKVKMLSEILETQYLPSDLDQPAPLRQASRFITDEDNVDHVSSKWHHTIVDRALELTPIGASTMSWTRGCHDRLPNAPPNWTGTDAFSVPWEKPSVWWHESVRKVESEYERWS